jgi:O-antigen/teichoic acid export membrane protein
LTIEKSKSRDGKVMTGQTMLRVFLLVSAIAAVVALTAPIMLRLYGGRYAADGVVVMRLLVLAAPFRALAVMAMSDARSHGRTGFIIRLQAMTSAVVIVVALLLTRSGDIKGIAYAWLLAQVLAAGVVMIRRWRAPAATLAPA